MRYFFLILIVAFCFNANAQDSYEALLKEQRKENRQSLRNGADFSLDDIEQVPRVVQLYSTDVVNWAYMYSGIEDFIPEITARKSGKVAVVIIDTGVPNHQDLQHNRLSQFDKQFADNLIDGNGHSTHIGGIIGSSKHRVGILGSFSDDVVLIYVEALADNGSGNYTDVADSFRYVEEITPVLQSMGFNVVTNASLGGSGYSEDIAQAIDALWQLGVVVNIVAAGNNGAPVLSHPADTDVISVGAFDQNEERAQFSNYNDKLTLSAPGVNIYSCWLYNQYATLDGTSMSAPYISAMAALAWMLYPDATNFQIARLLIATATDLGPEGPDKYFGAGVPKAKDILDNDPRFLPDEPFFPEEPEQRFRERRTIPLSFEGYTLRWRPYNSTGEYSTVELAFDIELTTKLYAEDAWDELEEVIAGYFNRITLGSRVQDDFVDVTYWGRHFLSMYLRGEGYNVSFVNTYGEDGDRETTLGRYSALASRIKKIGKSEIHAWLP